MRRVGKRQMEWLILLSCVDRVALTSDKASQALVQRGLLRTDNAGTCITAAGLRVLADEMDAGRMQDALARMREQAKARRKEAPRDAI